MARGDSGADADGGAGGPAAWLRRTDWLWLVIGGFYLLAYLFWYVPALAALPGSLRDPPEQFPWHWPLDFASTGLAGAVLLALGVRRAAALTEAAEDGAGDELAARASTPAERDRPGERDGRPAE